MSAQEILEKKSYEAVGILQMVELTRGKPRVADIQSACIRE